MRGDTVRLRLTRGEVDQIGQGEAVVERTCFPDGAQLSYRLAPSTRTSASFAAVSGGQEILIEVATGQAQQWAASDEVGFSGEDAFTIGPLSILIEKDFTCITPREGDEELDTYPNPAIQ